MIGLLFFLFGSVILLMMFWLEAERKMSKRGRIVQPFLDSYRDLLEGHVAFYRQLDAAGKSSFEKRMEKFLGKVRITGVKTEVEDIDRVLVAASAIIPIYAFPKWEYPNLREVLIYPDRFNQQFEWNAHEKPILGMVGDGALNYTMILSKKALREGFSENSGSNNTAIHEFVHLIDKTDGSVDGIPELLLDKKYTIPWIDMIYKSIKDIEDDKSDIHYYGATNEAEFFAVASEYFFNKPDLLKEKHPELYGMLEKMFRKKTDLPNQ